MDLYHWSRRSAAGFTCPSKRNGGEMVSPAPSADDYRVPIRASIGRAYRSVFGHLRLAASFAWRPLLIILLIEVVGPLVMFGQNRILLLGLAPIIGFLVFGTIFVVRWQRFVLLGDSDNSSLFPPGWRPFL